MPIHFHSHAFAARLLQTAALLLAGAGGCALVSGGDDELRHPDAPPALVTIEDHVRREVSLSSVMASMDFLESDRIRDGGAVTSVDRVAGWVVGRFQLAGLEPAGDGGGYVQHWPASVTGDTVRAPNVVGLVTGSDPGRAGEPVIVMARLGRAGPAQAEEGGASRAGAPGVAMGLAALVEVAKAVAALPVPLPRPVLFLAVSAGAGGEPEGARWFAGHPAIDVATAVAVVALGGDGAGPLTVVGHAHSTLGPLLVDLALEHPGLDLEVTPFVAPAAVEPPARTGPRAAGPVPDGELLAAVGNGAALDPLPLARLGIPAVLVMPRPQEAETGGGAVDPDGAARTAVALARLVVLALHRVASLGATPEWTEEGRRAVPGR
jgi:hypothetical protein